MARQMTLLDWINHSDSAAQAWPEPEVGQYVRDAFACISHIMRPLYIGRKVIFKTHQKTPAPFRCGILEAYVCDDSGQYKSVIDTGDGKKHIITHRPGEEIRECLPWNAYPKRMAAIGNRKHKEAKE